MSFWSRLFGSKYDDEEIVSAIQPALIDDPMITDHSKISVSSEDGVVTLAGSVEKQLEKDHIEGAVRDAVRYKGLKFERIANDITVKPRETAQ